MQQQFFKSMDNHTFSTKLSHSSKRGTTGVNFSQRKKEVCSPFELTEKQAEAIRLNLAKPFYLINITNGQFHKIQKQCRAEYEQRANKPNRDEIRREDKKIQQSTKPGNANNATKAELKEEYKPRGEEHPKKQKKQMKKTWGKLSEARPMSGLQSQFQQVQQNENQQQPILKQDEGVKKKEKDIKQKKHKEIALEKLNTEKEIKIQNKSSGHSKGLKGKIQKEKNFKFEKKEQHLEDNYGYTIPYLSNGQPRYDSVHPYFKANQQPNRLCAMFGLPHEPTQQQQNTLLNEKQKNFCYNIVQKLKQHRFSQAFRNPVDPQGQGVPDYHYVVYNPMDLYNITKKIKDKYHHIAQFHADINLIFMNSYKYNVRTNKYFGQTIQFEDYYRQLLDHAAKNPQLYAEKVSNKVKCQKMDANEADYTGESNKKNKRKFPELFSHGKDLTKSQLFQRQSRHKLSKNRSMMDEHSNFSHSLQGLENYQDMNQQMQNNSQPTQKTMKKQLNKSNKQVKVRKSDSLSFSVQDYQGPSHKNIFESNKQSNQDQPQQQNQQFHEAMANQDPKEVIQNPVIENEVVKKIGENQDQVQGQKQQISDHNLDIQCIQSKILKNEEYLGQDQQLNLNLDMMDQKQIYEKQQNPQQLDQLPNQEVQQINEIIEQKPQLIANVPEAAQVPPNHYFNNLRINPQQNQAFSHNLETLPAKTKYQYFHQHMPYSRDDMHLLGYHHHQAKYEQEMSLLKSKNNGKEKHRYPNISQPIHPYNYHSNYSYADFHQHQHWLNQYNPHNPSYPHIKEEDHHQNNESITVNNINLQPQHYYTNNMIQGPYHGYLPQQSIYPSIDTIMQNTIVNNNSTQVSKPKQSNKTKATGKSFKKKGKNQDDQDQYKYNSDEDEEYVIEVNRVGKKKNRQKKIKEKKIVKQNSSGQQKSQKKRGRQPKKQIPDEKVNNSINGGANDLNDQSLFLQPLVPQYQQAFNQQIGQNIDYENLFIEKNDSYDEVHEGINLDFQDDNLKFM